MRPAPALPAPLPYAVPRAAAPIDLWLDGNEGPEPDPAWSRLALEGDALRRYPDARPLEARLAARHGTTADRVLVTAGADDALDRICRTFLPGRALVVPGPGFEMLERYARAAGAEVVHAPWDGPDWPLGDVLAAIHPQVAVVVVTTPDNPTGGVATIEDLRRLRAAAPDVWLVVDLAYAAFADQDPTAELAALPGTLVVHTLSKGHGLAGLRVGYVLGDPEPIGWLRAAGPPYAVSGPSLALAERALDSGDDRVARHASRVRAHRERLEAAWSELGARVRPSQANFAFARVPDALWVRDAAAGLGIAVRAFPGRAGLEDAVRVAVPADPEALERLAHALGAAMRPEAWLFDLDGVLADVSASYREAIVRTASRFGAEVTAAEIATAKAAGDANDDWALTRRLVARRGREVPLAEVVEVFQAIYLGERLFERETARVPAAALQRWAEVRPLALVTGRPREEALRFLADQGWGDLFAAVVAREDSPALKPDPAPVREALRRLGVRRAWMLGDTPDDQRAARGAGVVPLGVLAPGDTDGTALTAAGAARVLASPLDLDTLGGAT